MKMDLVRSFLKHIKEEHRDIAMQVFRKILQGERIGRKRDKRNKKDQRNKKDLDYFYFLIDEIVDGYKFQEKIKDQPDLDVTLARALGVRDNLKLIGHFIRLYEPLSFPAKFNAREEVIVARKAAILILAYALNLSTDRTKAETVRSY
jgi:UDP-N-acetylmuramyl pentapeptide synthase